MVKFVPLSLEERLKLRNALDLNALHGKAMLMDKETNFAGTADEVPDEEVVSAVRSIPCHY